MSVAVLDLHQQVGALDLHLEHLEVRLRRRAQRLAGLHVEPRRVQRALDAAIFQPAIGQQRIFMRCRCCRWRGSRRREGDTARSPDRRRAPRGPDLPPHRDMLATRTQPASAILCSRVPSSGQHASRCRAGQATVAGRRVPPGRMRCLLRRKCHVGTLDSAVRCLPRDRGLSRLAGPGTACDAGCPRPAGQEEGPPPPPPPAPPSVGRGSMPAQSFAAPQTTSIVTLPT